jgi:NAD(P)-dependent dehydrogenase (short-subunit alcohol dehydrogenase family)
MQRSSPAEDGNRALQRLRGLGATVEVVQGDVTNEEDVARAVALAGKGATLRGVVHSAAALDDDLIVRQSAERFETVLAPKVRGALNLHRQTASAELDHFVLFSSGASFMGPPGQSNYSAANNFIDGLVARRRVDGLPGLAVNWGAWGEVGGAVRLGLMKTLGRFGVAPISPADGMAALERLMEANVEQAAVLRVDWPRFVERVWLGDTPSLMRELVQPDHASELAQQRRAGSIMPPSASA